MDEIFVYVIPLPDGIREMVTPCLEGYTVYIDEKLDDVGRTEAYQHALSHITSGDFHQTSVQQIEMEAHQ